MKRNHGAETSGLAAVVRAAFASSAGVAAPGPAALAALALVEGWLRGDPVTRDEIEAARKAAYAEGEQASKAASAIKGGPRWKERAAEANALVRKSWGATAAGNLCWSALKERGWQDASSTIDAATYSVEGSSVKADALEAIRARAVAAASPEVRGREPPGGAAAKPRRVTAAELAPRLGPVAAALLARRKPRVDPKLRADAETLRALLARHEYPCHASVLELEARYGGLLVAESGGDEDWYHGAFACLSGGGHSDPRGGRDDLVPVVYSPNDVIYYLDAEGTVWGEDTIEDLAVTPFARGADRLVAKLALYDAAFGGKAAVAFEGARGREIAKALEVDAIREASDDLGRFWGDGKRLVVEDLAGGVPGTRVFGVSRSKLAAFGPVA